MTAETGLSMTSPLSAQQLVELAHRYLPSSLPSSAPGYFESEQYERLEELRESLQRHCGPIWDNLLERIEEALLQHQVQDWTLLLSDNCLRARVHLPEVLNLQVSEAAECGQEHRTVVLLVSILAPVYCLYSSIQVRVGQRLQPSRTCYEDLPETKRCMDTVDSIIRAELGFQRLHPDVLFTPVPDLSFRHKGLGEARLIDCLFTDDRW